MGGRLEVYPASLVGKELHHFWVKRIVSEQVALGSNMSVLAHGHCFGDKSKRRKSDAGRKSGSKGSLAGGCPNFGKCVAAVDASLDRGKGFKPHELQIRFPLIVPRFISSVAGAQ